MVPPPDMLLWTGFAASTFEPVELPPVLPMLLPVLCVCAVLVVVVVPVYLELTAELLLAVVPVPVLPVELVLAFVVCAELPVLLAPVDVLGLVYFELTAELLRGEVFLVVPVDVELVLVLVLVVLELEEVLEPPLNRLEIVVISGVVQKLMFSFLLVGLSTQCTCMRRRKGRYLREIQWKCTGA